MVHGSGAPHASLANIAASTPLISRAASCTPRVVIKGSCKQYIKSVKNNANNFHSEPPSEGNIIVP